MKQLIKMSDYVLDKQRFKEDSDIAIFNVTNYANILNQPLELGMFVPCDDEGNVLNICDCKNECGYCKELEKYQQAKSKVLFKGFELNFETSNITGITNLFNNFWFYKNGTITFNSKRLETIENLIPYNLELTDNQF